MSIRRNGQLSFYLILAVAVIILILHSTVGVSAPKLSVRTSHARRNQKADSTNWKNITSVADLWSSYPDRLRLLIHNLNLNAAGFKKTKKYLQRGDTVKAAKAILSYYKKKKNPVAWSNEISDEDSSTVIRKVKNILQDRIDLRGNGPIQIPQRSDGGLDWNFLGPHHREEYGYKLNITPYFLTLLTAWRSTNRASYPKSFDQLVRDWTIHNPLPAQGDSVYMVLRTSTQTLDWRDIGEVRWRPLEVGNRMSKVWPQVFYGFQHSNAFTPAARLLMLASIAQQANYLYKYHEKHHNHALFELNGLAMVGLAFPEFKQSKSWFAHARAHMLSEIKWLIYPDGLSKELTTSYDIDVIELFKKFNKIARKAHKNVGQTFNQTLAKMYNYVAYAMRPSGQQPLNNDSDLRSVRSFILKAAKRYHRPDWRWIATNGKAGQKPSKLSETFPWAGINIMRSGWGKNDQWAFFDTGPYGTAHQHNDKLHLSISAYGRNLLVDAGRYTYENYFNFNPQTWRGYFRSSFSHNVLLVDGKGENPGSDTATSPLKKGVHYVHKPTFDYARGTFTQGFHQVKGKLVFTRAVFYKRGDYWLVVDRVKTDRPHKIQALWHYSPDCKVQTKGTETYSANAGKGNLRIIPMGTTSWKVHVVKGQTKPIHQGWFSPEMGKKMPSPVAIYTTKIKKSSIFAWLLVPAKGRVPSPKAHMLSSNKNVVKISIQQHGHESVIISVPLSEGEQPSIK